MEVFSNIVLNLQAPAFATVFSPQGQTLSRSIQASLMDGATPWGIPETALCIIRYAKPDGTKGFYDTMEDDSSAYSYNGNVVTFGLATQALTVPGTVLMQLDFYNSDGEKLSTFTFRLIVAEGVFVDSDIASEDFINVLTAKLTEAAEIFADGTAEAQQIFDQIKQVYGAPWTAATAAAMTDTSRVYVYTGTTTDTLTNGHWYYWDGSAWADGGNYNSTGFTTDTTLSVAGAAADAAKTGALVAPVFSELNAYSAGDYVLYNGQMYQFTTAHAAGAWAAAEAQAVDVAGEISDLSRQLSDAEDAIMHNSVVNGLGFISGKYIDDAGNEASSTARLCSEYVPCMPNKDVKYVAETNRDIISGIAFYDINKNWIQSYCNNGTKGTEITVTSPANTAFCRISTDTATLANSYVLVPNGSGSYLFNFVNAQIMKDTFYIATDGNDSTGNGTAEYPYATIDKALKNGASKILVKGGKYYQVVDMRKAKRKNITIASYDRNQRAIFIHPTALISDSETSTEYENVYKVSYSETIRTGTRLYQEDVADVNTVITDAERNPYERGQTYRCLDTKIEPCSASSLNDAITEIQNGIATHTYKYFYDTSNHIIYYSRPQTINTTNPLMRSTNYSMLSYTDASMQLSIYGIESKYMRIELASTICHLEDCKCSYAYGSGCFIYGQCLSATFIRCEASQAHGDGTGDGFNAHSVKTGDPFSKQTTSLHIDCWAHDCLDDGYSDHERCEVEIHGGLYEYNGKAGITPSYGSHCSCYNVVSRNNYSGFLYLGEVTQDEGGKYGQMLCVMCIAENNVHSSYGYGFGLRDAGNLAKLINCKAIGNRIGFFSQADTIMELIDCGSLANTTEKNIRGTLVVNNTATVTAT